LTNAGFPDQQLELFIRGVCSWGGYAGIAGRILKQNSLVDIRAQFVKAANYLVEVEPNPVCSLAAINQITQLRTPSFGMASWKLILTV